MLIIGNENLVLLILFRYPSIHFSYIKMQVYFLFLLFISYDKQKLLYFHQNICLFICFDIFMFHLRNPSIF